jgi:hypothetical protein
VLFLVFDTNYDIVPRRAPVKSGLLFKQIIAVRVILWPLKRHYLHCLNEKFNKSGCLKCNGPSDFKADYSIKPNDPFGGDIL